MALVDRITLTLAEVKNYLKVEHAQDDALIERLIAAAAERAEDFLCHDFGTDPVPGVVETWILERVAGRYQRRAMGLRSEQLADRSLQWKDEMDEFGDLWPYRQLPGV